MRDLDDYFFKKELFVILKPVKYNDLEDMVFRMNLTFDEIEEILNKKNNNKGNKSYQVPWGVYEA